MLVKYEADMKCFRYRKWSVKGENLLGLTFYKILT